MSNKTGHGLSPTAMVFKIATIAGKTLSVRQMNSIKDINPRTLKRVYDDVVHDKDKTKADIAMQLLFS